MQWSACPLADGVLLFMPHVRAANRGDDSKRPYSPVYEYWVEIAFMIMKANQKPQV